MATIPITKRGAEKLKTELHRLKTVDRPAVIAAIAEARAQGDLSENAEYEAAKDRQGFIEGRIQEVDQRKYHDLFDNSSAGIFVARGDGQLFSFNRAFVELSWLPQAPGGAGSPRRLTEALWQNPRSFCPLCLAGRCT